MAILVECVTDNKNSSSADIRSTFTRNHGSLGTPGSVAHLFARKGEIRVPVSAIDEEKLLEAALDGGADDVQIDGDEHIVLTAPDQLFAVGEAWGREELGIRHVHLVTEVVEDHLRALRVDIAARRRELPAAKFVLASLPGEQHELGLLMTAVPCEERGVSVCLIGSTPLVEIARTAQEVVADAVVISVSLASAGVYFGSTRACVACSKS